jgi:hypothetical protein
MTEYLLVTGQILGVIISMIVATVMLVMDTTDTQGPSWWGGLLLFMILIIGFSEYGGRELGYKEGFIDGATGQPGYELVTHNDGSRSWEHVETGKQ